MSIADTVRNEQTLLRSELQELKKCQLQYFITSVGGSGLILGFQSFIPNGGCLKVLSIMSPLVIIIPCWWTFFDKATTITRLTGYMRVMERQLSKDVFNSIGYERGLSFFRKQEELDAGTQNRKKCTFKILTLRTRHRYWTINYYTFFVLSFYFLVLPFATTINRNSQEGIVATLAHVLMATIFVYSSKRILSILNDLIDGRYSYDVVEKFWEEKVFQKVNMPQSNRVIGRP